MDLSSSLFADDGGFELKPTLLSFHSLWQISVLSWVLFPTFKLWEDNWMRSWSPFCRQGGLSKVAVHICVCKNLCSLVLARYIAVVKLSQILLVHDAQTCFSDDFYFLGTFNPYFFDVLMSFVFKDNRSLFLAIVICLFFVYSACYLRCSLIYIMKDEQPCNDKKFKLPLLVLNSAINQLLALYLRGT